MNWEFSQDMLREHLPTDPPSHMACPWPHGCAPAPRHGRLPPGPGQERAVPVEW